MFVLLLVTSFHVYSQSSVKSSYTKSFKCRQNSGCDSIVYDFRQDLFVTFNNKELKWTKSIYENWTLCDIRKKTDTYIIALVDEMYVFFDVTKKSLYYIDFYKDNYLAFGYGPDETEIRENVFKMISMLESYKTQKDVMKYLIDQVKWM